MIACLAELKLNVAGVARRLLEDDKYTKGEAVRDLTAELKSIREMEMWELTPIEQQPGAVLTKTSLLRLSNLTDIKAGILIMMLALAVEQGYPQAEVLEDTRKILREIFKLETAVSECNFQVEGELHESA